MAYSTRTSALQGRKTPFTGAVTGGQAFFFFFFRKNVFWGLIWLVFCGFFVSTLARNCCSIHCTHTRIHLALLFKQNHPNKVMHVHWIFLEEELCVGVLSRHKNTKQIPKKHQNTPHQAHHGQKTLKKQKNKKQCFFYQKQSTGPASTTSVRPSCTLQLLWRPFTLRSCWLVARQKVHQGAPCSP